jgi:ATP-dependent RNA helicase DDX6/DHH1
MPGWCFFKHTIVCRGVVMREKARRQGNLADLKRRPETLIKRREKVLAHIEAAKNRQAQDTQAEMDEHQQALQRSNEAMTKLREQIGEIDDNIARYTDSLRHIEERLEAATDEMRKNETTKGKTEQSIATLERQMKDKSTVFGARTHEIQALVKQHEKQFSRLPLGPLGMNVVLKDETWAVAVEAACGNVLGTYIVFSSQDEVTLRSILRQANFNPEEFVSKRFLIKHSQGR